MVLLNHAHPVRTKPSRKLTNRSLLHDRYRSIPEDSIDSTTQILDEHGFSRKYVATRGIELFIKQYETTRDDIA